MQVDLAVSWLRVFGCCLMMVMLVRKSSRFLASVNSETVQSARPPKTGLWCQDLDIYPQPLSIDEVICSR